MPDVPAAHSFNPLALLRLAVACDADSERVKAHMKVNTEETIALGVSGVPAFAVDGKVFWGLDALPMLRGCLLGSTWFSGPGWNEVSQVSTGIECRR